MNKIYKQSRIIVAIITLILLQLLTINEDKTWFFFSWMFSMITFIISFPTTIIAKKIIETGNKIKNRFIRILYYIIIPIVSLILFSIVYSIIIGLTEKNINNLSEGLLLFLIIITVFITIMLPYVQSLVIIILKKIKKYE